MNIDDDNGFYREERKKFLVEIIVYSVSISFENFSFEVLIKRILKVGYNFNVNNFNKISFLERKN